MKIGIIGAGNVGGTLGQALAKAGHQVTHGVRDPADPKHRELKHGAVATVQGAVAGAEAVILATPWNGSEAALKAAGDFGGKPLLDATNPIGPGFALTHGHTDSGAEQVSRWAANAKVVKCFNTTGVENMANPVYGQARAAMLVCGDDDKACETAVALAQDLGFDAVRLGGLKQARVLEPMAMAWIGLTRALGRGFAFGLLRR
jgi:predicted dinucleotide-binding enzyme